MMKIYTKHALNDLVNTRELPSACLFLLVLRGIVFNLNYLNYNYLHRMKKNTAKNSSSSSRDDNKANANAKTQRQRRKHEKTSRRLRSEKREREREHKGKRACAGKQCDHFWLANK